MKVAPILFVAVTLAALAQTPGVPRSSAPAQQADSNARVAVLETKVEALGIETRKLEQKIDTLVASVQDLNTKIQDLTTKMNLVLFVATILFGGLITQVAGALGTKRNQPVSANPSWELAHELEELKLANRELKVRAELMREMSERDRQTTIP